MDMKEGRQRHIGYQIFLELIFTSGSKDDMLPAMMGVT